VWSTSGYINDNLQALLSIGNRQPIANLDDQRSKGVRHGNSILLCSAFQHAQNACDRRITVPWERAEFGLTIIVYPSYVRTITEPASCSYSIRDNHNGKRCNRPTANLNPLPFTGRTPKPNLRRVTLSEHTAPQRSRYILHVIQTSDSLPSYPPNLSQDPRRSPGSTIYDTRLPRPPLSPNRPTASDLAREANIVSNQHRENHALAA